MRMQIHTLFHRHNGVPMCQNSLHSFLNICCYVTTFYCWIHHPTAHPNSIGFSIVLYQQLTLNGNGDSKPRGPYSLEDAFKVCCLVTREVALCFIYLVLHKRKCASACVPLQSKQIHCGVGAWCAVALSLFCNLEPWPKNELASLIMLLD